MNSETHRIADQLHRSWHGDAWHGPSLTELLADVDAASAAAKVGNVHNIWEIVLHLTTWNRLAAKAIRGAAIPPWPFPEDWPAVEGDWTAAQNALGRAIEDLESASIMAPLEQTVPGRDYNFYHLLHGIVQHNLYHAGQIALLKKL